MTKNFGRPVALPPLKRASVQTRIAALQGRAPETRKSNPWAAVVLPLILVVTLCSSVLLPFSIAGQEGMQWARNLTLQRSVTASREAALKTASSVMGDAIAPFKSSSISVSLPFRSKWALPVTAYSARTSAPSANASPALFSGLSQFFAARTNFAAARSGASTASLRVRRDVADAVAAIGRSGGARRGASGFIVAEPGQNATPISRLGDYRAFLGAALPRLKDLSAPAYVAPAPSGSEAASGQQIKPAQDNKPEPLGLRTKRVEGEAMPDASEPRAALDAPRDADLAG